MYKAKKKKNVKRNTLSEFSLNHRIFKEYIYCMSIRARHESLLHSCILEIEWREVSYCLIHLFRKNSIFRPTSVGHHQELD